MDERFKILTIKLSRELMKVTNEFLGNNMNKKENIHFVINFILSSHISSLHNSLNFLLNSQKLDTQPVLYFMNNLNEFILSQLDDGKLEKKVIQ